MPLIYGEVDARPVGVPQTRGVLGAGASATSTAWSEAGIGALMPWAGKLWFVNYPDQNAGGAGLGLWSVDPATMTPTLVAETNVTSAARAVLSNYLFIGVHRIDVNGNVTPITGFGASDRIAAYAKLPSSSSLWAWTMDGNIWTINTTTCVATQSGLTNPIGSASVALNIVGQPHGKALWGHPQGRYLFCTLNGNNPDGRLGIYDTQSGTWTDVDTGHNSWIEVSGSYDGNQHVFAVGHDYLSIMLWVFNGAAFNATPVKYRIPLPSNQQVAKWQQEWMRIRAVETERYLMDAHGGWFQLSSYNSGSDAYTDPPYLEAVSRHLRTVPDFCFWNGYFVASGNQATPQSGNKYPNVGSAQSGLLFSTLDDIWSYGKPGGVGFWYKNASVTSGTLSDLMLMRGYGTKELNLVNGTGTAVDVDIRVRMSTMTADFSYLTLTVPANGHAGAALPGCDWVAIKPAANCTDLTAWVVCS